MKIDISPLSINKAFKGRRFKTPEYKQFEEEFWYRLPNDFKVPEGKLQLWIVFGTSSKLSDTDNFLKLSIDVLQKKYNFNDRRIFRILADKHITKKGEEFISFQFYKLTDKFK